MPTAPSRVCSDHGPISLFAEYHSGAVASHARFGVEDDPDPDTEHCARDIALFWVTTDIDGRVVGGVRAKVPLASSEESHAVVEWAGRPGESTVRRMITDRVPLGVLEMKAAWLSPEGSGDRRRIKLLARSVFCGMARLGINFCMPTSAAHVLEQWQSSGGVIASIPATPYPNVRYQTKMPWWNRRTYSAHGEADQIAAIALEVAHVHRQMRMVSKAGASMPPLTSSHSTRTVPLNATGSAGVRTTRRVTNSAVPAGAYAFATPVTKNSSAA